MDTSGAVRRAMKTSYRASQSSLRPLYTGGPVLLTQDGSLIITTMGEEVLVTDVTTGRVVSKIRGDTTPITSLCLSYHTSPPTLITTHRSTTIRYYPLHESLTPAASTSTPLLAYTRQIPRAHTAPILVSAVSPDNTLLATGSADGVVKVWDLAGGFVTHLYRGHGGPVSAICFNFPASSSSGPSTQKMELLTGSVDTRVRLYDLRDNTARTATGGMQAKPKAVMEGHVSVVRGLAVSEDGRWAVSGGRDRVVLVWDLQSGAAAKKGGKGKAGAPQIVQTIMALEQVEALGLLKQNEEVHGAEEGRLLCYTAGDKGMIRVWDVLKATEVVSMASVEGVDVDEDAEVDEDEQRGVIDVLYNPSTSSLVSIHADQNILFHSLAQGTVTRQIIGFNDEIIDAVFVSGQASTSQLALATNSNLIRLYSTSTFDSRLLSGHKDMVLCLDKSIDGQWLASGSKDRTARIWGVDEATTSWRCLAVCEGHAESVGAVAMSRKIENAPGQAARDGPQGRFLFTASQDRTVKMWDLTFLTSATSSNPIKPRSLATLRIHEKDINSLDLAPNDRLLASGSQDKLVKIFDVDFNPAGAGAIGASGAIKLIGTCKGHRRGVWTVKFSRTDRVVASGAADMTIRLWSLEDYSCLKTFEGHTNSVLRVDFLTTGMQLVSTASDGLVKLWNVKDEECVKTLDNHEDKIWALAVSADEKTIVSAGADSIATFWEDCTVIEQEERNQKVQAAVQHEQDFTNYLNLKDYRKAILLALAMSQPGRLLHLFTTVAASRGDTAQLAILDAGADSASGSSITGSLEVDHVIKTLPGIDLVRLLRHVRDWNARAKTSPVAQIVLHAILRLRTPDDVLAAFDSAAKSSLKADADAEEVAEEKEEEEKTPKAKAKAPAANLRELLDALLPYSERHFSRLDRLMQDSYMLDYALSEMDGGVFGGEVMEIGGR